MASHRLLKNRTAMIALYLVVVGVVGYAVTVPLTWQLEGYFNFEKTWGLTSVLLALGFVGLHVLFLWPIRKPSAAGASRPLWVSLVVAGLLIGVLGAAGVLAASHAVYATTDNDVPSDSFVMWGTLGVGVGGWIIATPLLIAFTKRGRPESVVQRIAARLFVGTIIEAAAIIPLDALVRRKEDCVCATGTYLGLTLCGAVGLFVLGPAVLLPVLARRRKRWYAGHCEVCGYDMSRTKAVDRCPECGSGWKAA